MKTHSRHACEEFSRCPQHRSIQLGSRVRVRCICGHHDCLAPALKGGAAGEVVNFPEPGLVSVILDKHEGVGALDFPSHSVKREDA
jgi:hypothetical protein